jgi:hypothetical protein
MESTISTGLDFCNEVNIWSPHRKWHSFTTKLLAKCWHVVGTVSPGPLASCISSVRILLHWSQKMIVQPFNFLPSGWWDIVEGRSRQGRLLDPGIYAWISEHTIPVLLTHVHNDLCLTRPFAMQVFDHRSLVHFQKSDTFYRERERCQPNFRGEFVRQTEITLNGMVAWAP